MGLPKLKNQWMSLTALANTYQLLSEVYVTSGIQFPRSETFLMITSSQNLLIAVRINDRYPDLDTFKPYLHVYSNAYFESKRSSDANKRWIDVRTLVPKSDAELRAFQITLMDLVAEKGGYPQYFVNGRIVNEISLTTAGVGDYCEFVLDPSIKKVVDFPISSLPVFNSSLDQERKYILHYNDPTVKTIDYFDDIDAYLIKTGSTADRFMGVMYHHNEGNWMRMLTHKDYSVPVARIDTFIVNHPEDPRHAANPTRWPSDKWTGTAGLVLRLYIRHSGYDRPLVAESSRINLLYRLKDQDIVRAMTGADATCPIWRAENLERAAYVQFMSAHPDVIYPIAFQDPDATSSGKVAAQNFAGDVFGYHEAANIQAHNPSKVYTDQTQRYADLAYNYWEDATIFEYNAQGILLGYYYHTAGKRWPIQNADCAMIEAITGQGSTDLDGTYGNAPVPLPGGYNFRVYVSPVWAGVVTNEWKDITELENRSDWGFLDNTGDEPIWQWTIDPTKWYGYVRRDHRFYMKEMRFSDDAGLIWWALDNWETHNGEAVNKLLEIPFGQYDVFLNNRPVISGLDYIQKGTRTVMSNLEYRNVGGINTVLVRGTGFCTTDLKQYPPGEIGFIEYGLVSSDSRFNIHTNKMQRIIIDGHYKDPADIVFDEDRNTLTTPGERNGAPFQIQTPQVTFKDVYDTDTKARIIDDEKDQQASDYLTAYFGQTVHTSDDLITDHYTVYSAFSNRIVKEIKNGNLKPPFVNGHYSDQDIVDQLKSYEWLQEYDILNNGYNTNHVKVFPHWETSPVSLTSDEYDYYVRIIKLYLRQPMDISPFFTVS
ncbi:virion structural protein [Pseudomonas phage PhiPA3]|uniref:Virion structural protein n=1 Tax=Pseudomonas phage PhiPA3 TaxID=998086 RepID=F8SJP0_BPPA3|nr:virion structural protein [Pseudomonas phage PhiPA3]AEH03435.1 virion structural protein [Pseudomonas phage PhiPA3]